MVGRELVLLDQVLRALVVAHAQVRSEDRFGYVIIRRRALLRLLKNAQLIFKAAGTGIQRAEIIECADMRRI